VFLVLSDDFDEGNNEETNDFSFQNATRVDYPLSAIRKNNLQAECRTPGIVAADYSSLCWCAGAASRRQDRKGL
jgi:hypothetical protein